MNYGLLINILVSFFVVSVIFLKLIKNYNKKNFKKISKLLLVLGFSYSFLLLFCFLWFFNFLKYSENDFLFIFSILVVIESFVFLRIIYQILKLKKLFYFVLFYLVVFLSIFSSLFNFLELFLISSYLLILLIFMSLTFGLENYRKIGYIGMIYASISLIFQILYLFNILSLMNYILFSNFVFLIFIFLFLKSLKKDYFMEEPFILEKNPGYWLSLFRYFVFIITFAILVFIGTIGIHEFGHLTISKMSHCDYRRIVYSEETAYTEVLCDDLTNNVLFILGGVLLPFIVATLLFIVGGKFMQEIGFLIVGFNLIVSCRDFLDLGISKNLIVASVILGVIFLGLGVLLLAKIRTEEYF